SEARERVTSERDCLLDLGRFGVAAADADAQIGASFQDIERSVHGMRHPEPLSAAPRARARLHPLLALFLRTILRRFVLASKHFLPASLGVLRGRALAGSSHLEAHGFLERLDSVEAIEDDEAPGRAAGRFRLRHRT